MPSQGPQFQQARTALSLASSFYRRWEIESNKAATETRSSSISSPSSSSTSSISAAEKVWPEDP